MKDQFVIAHLTDLDNIETVYSHARRMADMLQKSIILLYITDERYNCLSTEDATEKLKAITADHSDTTYCAIKGKTKEIVTSLPTMLNGVVAVVQVDKNAAKRTPTHKKEVLRNYADCKISYLAVQQPASPDCSWEQVAMTMDYHRESKEKLIWTSYFARFNHSKIHILSQHYKDEGLRDMWRNNMLYLKNFFEKLSLPYQQSELQGQSTYPDIDALQHAQQQHIGLIIATTTPTRQVDFIEWFTGTQEQRTIINDQRIPILYINPRDDMYVLCD